MSYLIQHALSRSSQPRPIRRGARVDECTLLNRPAFDGGAHVSRVRRGHVGPATAPPASTVAAAEAADRRLRKRDQPRVLGRLGRATRELALQDRDADRGTRALPCRPRGRGGAASAAGARLARHQAAGRSGLQFEQQLTTIERRCEMSYLKRLGTRRVPQWAPISNSGQVPNSAGGFAWAVDDWARLRRFLILGSEGGSYYASEWTLTRENARARRALPGRGRPAGGGRDRPRQRGGPGSEERPHDLRAGDGGRPRRRADAKGGAGGAAAGLPHRHAPVPVRDVRRGLPRLGPLAAARGRSLVRRPAGGGARVPGGQVPPARGRHAPRPAAAGPPGRAGERGQPDTRGLGRARASVRVDRPRRRDRPAAAPGRGLRPSAGGGDAGRDGRARPGVRPAPRGGAERAPDRGGGVGGAARGHADDGDDPQPGDDDAGRRPRGGIGRHGAGRRAAR